MDRPSAKQVAVWYPRLFRTALRLTGNREDSSDLTQQAFCKALSCWEQFDGRCQPATWLHGILVNCVRDWFRKKTLRSTEVLPEWSLVDASTAYNGTDGDIDQRERLEHLRQAIEVLPEKIRRAFIAAVLDGYTYKEISEMLSVPVGTIAHRVYKARRSLRITMLERFPEA